MLSNMMFRVAAYCLPDPGRRLWPPYGSICRETEVPASRGSGAPKSAQVWRAGKYCSAAHPLLMRVVPPRVLMNPTAGPVL